MKNIILGAFLFGLSLALEIPLRRVDTTNGLVTAGGSPLYVTDISVGTPPQNLTVVFDTTVSTLWIPASSCPKPLCDNKRTFNPTKSKSLGINFGYISVKFQGNYVRAKVRSDYISMSLLETRNLSHSYVMFGLADVFPQSFKDAGFDGVFGLGPGETAHMIPSVLPQVIRNSKYRDYTKTTLLLSNPSEKGNNSIIIGDNYDQCEYVSHYDSLGHTDGWQFRVKGIGAGKRVISKTWKSSLNISTDYIHLPKEAFDAIVKELDAKIAGNGQYLVNCSLDVPITIQIEDTVHKTPSTDFYTPLTGDVCVLKIKETAEKAEFPVVIGTPFLYRRCAVLDHRYFDYRSVVFPLKKKAK